MWDIPKGEKTAADKKDDLTERDNLCNGKVGKALGKKERFVLVWGLLTGPFTEKKGVLVLASM